MYKRQYQNSIFGLTLLDKPCDDHIVFNFHYYNPLVFTHQKAHWIDKMTDECEISYPGPTKEYYEKSLKFIGPDLAQAYENYPIDIVDRRFMEAEMQVAADVGKKMNVPVYCGEYGVIDTVGGADLLRWYDDIHAAFDKFGFGRAAWNYKEKDFGIVDECRADIADEIVKHLKVASKNLK